MQVITWLKTAVDKLEKQSGTAQLDAEIILAHVLGVDRSWLHAHPDETIDYSKLDVLKDLLDRRLDHEPIAYILEKTEFYGLEFYITNGVLVPRPESETMIDLLLSYCHEKIKDNLVIIDVGSGSGALGIVASMKANPLELISIDIDSKCNEITLRNAKTYSRQINVLNGNLLEPVIKTNFAGKHLAMLANLPYVPESYSVNESAGREPKIAIFGGHDGLALYREMFAQLKNINAKSITVFTESLPFQHSGLTKIAEENNLKLLKEEDFIQVFTA